jgi:hypothetical protein
VIDRPAADVSDEREAAVASKSVDAVFIVGIAERPAVLAEDLTTVTSTYAVRPTNTTSTGPPMSVGNAFFGNPLAYVVTRPLRRSMRNTLPALPSVT